MANSEEHTELVLDELDWFIIDLLCKEIIGPRHEVERPITPTPGEKKKATAQTVAGK